MGEDTEHILGRMVRVGVVTSVDIPTRRARVKFEDEDNSSGLLRVLSSPPFIPKINGPPTTAPGAGGWGGDSLVDHPHVVNIPPGHQN